MRLAERSAVSCDSQRDKTRQTSKTRNPIKDKGTNGSHRKVMPGSANDHHTPAQRQMRINIALERERRDKNPNIRETPETGFLRQGAGTASERRVDMDRLAERGRGANEVQAHYPEELPEMARIIGQAAVGLIQTLLSFRIDPYVELVDAVALQTKHQTRVVAAA